MMLSKQNGNTLTRAFKIAKMLGVTIIVLTSVVTIVSAHWESKIEFREYTDKKVQIVRDEFAVKFKRLDTKIDQLIDYLLPEHLHDNHTSK